MRIDRIKFVVTMTEKNLTQRKLAEMSGVSRVTVSAIKNGKNCSYETAVRLAKALDVDLEELITD